MNKNLLFCAGATFLCIMLLFAGKVIPSHQYRYIIKIAVNLISFSIIFTCTFTILKKINAINYVNYMIYYSMTFMASWFCFFSNSLTKMSHYMNNNYNKTIPLALFAMGSLGALIEGFAGFRIIRSVKVKEYKTIGYLLSAFIMALSAAVVWLFGPVFVWIP